MTHNVAQALGAICYGENQVKIRELRQQFDLWSNRDPSIKRLYISLAR